MRGDVKELCACGGQMLIVREGEANTGNLIGKNGTGVSATDGSAEITG